MYANFNKSLSQIACEAPSSQRYSLARTCDDCAAAYKDWLCLVTIPRCEDFFSNATWLQARAISQPFPDGKMLGTEELVNLPNTTRYNSSRNPLIDQIIRPGPYRELLPCDDLCYKLVQNCPAQMGFGCPLPGSIGFEGNYERHQFGSELNCNYPGSAHLPSEGGRGMVMDWRVLVAGAVVVGLMAV
jgi:calcium channel MID1